MIYGPMEAKLNPFEVIMYEECNGMMMVNISDASAKPKERNEKDFSNIMASMRQVQGLERQKSLHKRD